MNNYESKNVWTNLNGPRNDICIFCQWLLMTYVIKLFNLYFSGQKIQKAWSLDSKLHWPLDNNC